MTRSILHIDGDSFFAACEISLNPRLRGLPVVTGRERGIATAMSEEAKKLGIFRGMPIFKIRELYPEVVICASSYSNYEIFSARMTSIVRRFTSEVEEYSIDECFADMTNLSDVGGAAREIKDTLYRELDMTFSVGVGPTKVLAKVASKHNKPNGFTLLTPELIPDFLRDLEIGKIWGIGPATSARLQRFGIRTALDFTLRAEDWVREHCGKSELLIWHELQGESLYSVHTGPAEDPKSIQANRTFTPATTDKEFIFSELSKNVECACKRVRSFGLSAKRVYYFLKTSEFRYHRFELSLMTPLSTPARIIEEIRQTFHEVYQPHTLYRASGVTLAGLVTKDNVQRGFLDELFPTEAKKRGGVDKWNSVFKVVDQIDRRYGSHSLVLGSSLVAFKRRGGAAHKHLKIPYMGEVV